MAGYYIPKTFAANYVSNKKSEDGTYTYDSAMNKVGVTAQRNLQQLNKQYNMTINSAQAGGLLANRGLRASALGSGYKEAFSQQLQQSVASEFEQANLTVQDAKQSIFAALGQDVSQIAAIQQQDVDNMRRMAGSLEQYHGYLQTLKSQVNSKYVEDYKFKVGDEWTFEDNYDKLFDTQKGLISNYTDDYNNAGLSWEDWLRQHSGDGEADVAWLDWAYSTGISQYKDFVKNGVNSIYK